MSNADTSGENLKDFTSLQFPPPVHVPPTPDPTLGFVCGLGKKSTAVADSCRTGSAAPALSWAEGDGSAAGSLWRAPSPTASAPTGCGGRASCDKIKVGAHSVLVLHLENLTSAAVAGSCRTGSAGPALSWAEGDGSAAGSLRRAPSPTASAPQDVGPSVMR